MAMTRSLFRCSYSGITLDPDDAITTSENKIYHKKTYEAWQARLNVIGSGEPVNSRAVPGAESNFIKNELQTLIFDEVFYSPIDAPHTTTSKKKIFLNLKVLICWLIQLDPQCLILLLQKNIELLEGHISENKNNLYDETLCDNVLDFLQTCLVNIFNQNTVIEIINSIDEIITSYVTSSSTIESAIWRYVILNNGVVSQTPFL